MVKIKRIYESPTPSSEDGKRVLIDRLWPRGLRKDEVVVDDWIKEIAPSSQLRKWFGHDPAKWEEFKKRYRQELEGKKEIVDRLRADARRGTLTILYSAKDTEHNNAVVLKELVQ
ncbi:MAG: hypothetical protein A4E57_03268 [Syntrophorhabdaceae bacterium PtaU1.Bin034]|jgi:uncharacterized protein YeaO (DUF488 family)|nr:MAG: hypothetical protein A4E57_03268 [Syntrophorhabdaceae bacterium PtaU1.Bin034]